ncbi:amino acid permease [Penicillium robsamsonii]|uniref:amino acid permease n=1 Tax=Penicillium robsamsonii TaxID=1792511 RepID=UPI002547B2D8|nr:amino acid permease [Penicillium robsamsonii]KAJ5817632.1 amino acid permease [Penicillium robsamsonii]
MESASQSRIDNRRSVDDTRNDPAEKHYTKSDAEQLAYLGHNQVLERNFSLTSAASLCMCLLATWEAVSAVISAALESGGAPCLLYNYVLSFLCTIAVGSSLAEIASIYPTAGGQYYWVAVLSPVSSRKSAAWFTGWISVGGQILLTAAAALSGGLQTQGLLIMNDDSYIPQQWQGMLFYWAVVLYAAFVNTVGSRILPHVNYASGIIHVGGFFATCITLAIMAPKNTASFVFKDFDNRSGWASDGVSWLVGLLSTVYPFLGYDAACHIAEEIPNPSRNVPLAMVGSILINGLTGLVYVILILFSTSSLDELLESPTGYPFLKIYEDAVGSPLGGAMLALAPILIAYTAAIAGTTSTSRTLWAFARDKATPCHDYLSKVSDKAAVPVRCIVVTTTLQMLLGLLYLGNTTAFNAVLSMAIIGMYLSYLLPIIYMLVYGRCKSRPRTYGFFKLGKTLGVMLNVISIIWIIVVVIFSTFPSFMPVSVGTANYSPAVMVVWLLFGGVYYFFYGRHKFDVPILENINMEVTIVPHA